MTITILYFASLREALGIGRESVELPGSVRTAGELIDWLLLRGDLWQQALGAGRPVRIAVDKNMADRDTPIGARAEVALFPPVTGG